MIVYGRAGKSLIGGLLDRPILNSPSWGLASALLRHSGVCTPSRLGSIHRQGRRLQHLHQPFLRPIRKLYQAELPPDNPFTTEKTNICLSYPSQPLCLFFNQYRNDTRSMEMLKYSWLRRPETECLDGLSHFKSLDVINQMCIFSTGCDLSVSSSRSNPLQSV